MAAYTVLNVDGIRGPLLNAIHGQAGSFNFAEGRGGMRAGEMRLWAQWKPTAPHSHMQAPDGVTRQAQQPVTRKPSPLRASLFPHSPPSSQMVYTVQTESLFWFRSTNIFLLPIEKITLLLSMQGHFYFGSNLLDDTSSAPLRHRPSLASLSGPSRLLPVGECRPYGLCSHLSPASVVCVSLLP